jgi:predicted DNA-binding transcriptional regulator AlpA
MPRILITNPVRVGESEANMSNQVEKYFDTPAAAQYVRLSVSTMEKLRVFGGGPPFAKLGRRVVYSAAALDDWLRARQFTSTSGYSKAHT